MVLSQLLQQPFAQTLASALEHFVWEGAVLGLALFALVRFLKPGAHVRYLMGVACLAAMALAPVVTAAVVSARGSAAADAAFASPVGQTVWASTAAETAGAATAPRWNAQALVVSAWLVGVLALSLRLGGGWVMTRRLVARSRDRASAEIRWLGDRISHQLALGRHIEIFESPTIVVPVLIGWLAPVVILPTAALSGLAPAQLEALIAHELAHVRRHDYLVNLLQSVVETLLFFHPAVWWVSRDVRESREHCCDDLVVGLCDRVVYASALADLAALVRGPRFALAATDGSLVSRVRRILGGKDDGRPARQEWIAAAILALLVVGTVPIAFASARGPASSQPVPQERLAAGLLEPAVAIRETPQVEPGTPNEEPVTAPALEKRDTGEQRIALDQSLRLADSQEPDVHVIELKLQRELDELNAQPALAQDVQDRQVELKAALERLRAMLEERQATDQQLRERRVVFEELQTKLAALERQIAERKGSLEGLDQDRMAEAKAKLEKAKAIDLDAAALSKLKSARIREAEEQLAAAQALMKREAEGNVEAVARLAKMKELRARENDVLTFKVPDGKVFGNFAKNPELKADKDGNVILFSPARWGATDFDPKEIQAVLAPAFDAGPNDVSVVGRVVKHPGRVEWHDGLTVEAALKAAGAPPITNADNVVRRLSQLQVTFGAGGPRVNGRVDEVNADTMLRPGDVIVVSPRVRK